jgi:hypothetical protein
MKLLTTWHFWTFISATGGIALAINDTAGWLGLAPARGLYDFWFGGITYVISFFGAAFLMHKTLEEAKKAA